MTEVEQLCKAMSEGHRLQALIALQDGELCVCHLIEYLRLRPGTVSRHLTILKHAGLIAARRAGKWQHIRLAPRPGSAAASALTWLFRSLRTDPIARGLRKRANKVRTMNPLELCDHYRK